MRPRTVYPRKSAIFWFRRIGFVSIVDQQRRFDSMPTRRGSSDVDTPTKGENLRRYQALGGNAVKGAATQAGREFGLKGTSVGTAVKKYDKQVSTGAACRNDRTRSKSDSGRRSSFGTAASADIGVVWEEGDTRTYREAAPEVGLPTSTLHYLSTEKMDYRFLKDTVRPLPSTDNPTKRVEMPGVIVEHPTGTSPSSP